MKKALFKNKKGSAIVWSVLVLAMLSIFVTASLTMAFAYHQRSVKSNLRRQAYFTSRSVAEAVAETVAAGNSPTSPFIPETVGAAYEDLDVSGLPGNMGNTAVSVTRKDEFNAVISATTVMNEMVYTYDVNMVIHCIDIPSFTHGMYISGQIPPSLTKIDGDLYLSGGGPYTLNIPVSGNVYVPNGTLTIGLGGNVSGRIYARTLAGYVNSGYVPLLIASPNALPNTIPAAAPCENVPLSEWGVMFNEVYDESEQQPSLVGIPDGGPISDLDVHGNKIRLETNKKYIVDGSEINAGHDVSYQLHGFGTVYIIVNDYVTFDVPNDFDNPNRQSVVFFLGRSSTLNIVGPQNGDVKMSVYGDETTAVNILSKSGGSSNQTVTVIGGIVSGTITSAHKLEIEPDDDIDYPPPASELIKVRWEISRTALG